MGNHNALFKEDTLNPNNIKEGVAVLQFLLDNYPAIHTLNYQYSNATLTEKQITGKNKSIDLKTLVNWGIVIKKRNKDAYKLNTQRLLVFEAVILLLKS